MATNQHPFAHRQPAQATALVGVLSLTCLPVVVSAQMMGPGIGRTMNGMNRPAIMNRSMPSSPMLGHPGGRMGGIGQPGGMPTFERPVYERPAIPGYGGNPFYYGSVFQNAPGAANRYSTQPAPNDAASRQWFNANQSQTRAAIGQFGGGQYGGGQGRVQRPGVPYNYPKASNRYNGGYYNYTGGYVIRRSPRYYGAWGANYLPGGLGYYPYYFPDYLYGLTGASPYYYYGTFPPYIGLDDVYQDPPQYDYVPSPAYTPDGQYQGNQSAAAQGTNPSRQQDNATPQNSAPSQYKVGEDMVKKNTLLNTAVADIASTWQNGDIQTLSKHIRPNARVAVYLRGKYQYSLDGSDYLDMTRDALRSTKTTTFTLNDVQRKQDGVYTVNGRHTYQDKEGKSHTVLVSYVLEKADNEYYITQIGTAPEKLEE